MCADSHIIIILNNTGSLGKSSGLGSAVDARIQYNKQNNNNNNNNNCSNDSIAEALGMPSAIKSKNQSKSNNKDWSHTSNRISIGARFNNTNLSSVYILYYIQYTNIESTVDCYYVKIGSSLY